MILNFFYSINLPHTGSGEYSNLPVNSLAANEMSLMNEVSGNDVQVASLLQNTDVHRQGRSFNNGNNDNIIIV